MSFKKGLAVTGFKFGLLARADGTDVTTGTPVGYVTKDDGVQTAIGDVTPTHKGNGQWTVDLTAAEMDGSVIGLTFTHVDAATVAMTISTVTKEVVDLNDFNAATDTIANVTTVATTTTNTDYVAPDNASITEILTNTTELQSQVGNISTGSAAISKRAATSVTTVGTSVGGTTYANTYTLDGIYHSVADLAGNIDVEYSFDVGGNGVAVEVVMDGYLSGNGDTLPIQAYNYIGSVWESVGLLVAASGTENIQVKFNLDIEHTGLNASLGEVKLRAYEAGGSLSAIQLNMDRVFISYSLVSQSAGYDGAQVWINTVNGTAGTEVHVNGVADNPVNTIADAITIGNSVGLSRFNSSPDSVITFTEPHNEEIWMGSGWTLNLGGQDISQTHINHCNEVSGVGISPGGEVHILNSHIGTTSLGQAHLTGCSLGSSLTLTQAGDYTLEDCKSGIAGATSPIIDMGVAVGVTRLAVRGWNGGLIINNLAIGDVVTLDGTFGTITLNGADAQVELRGIAKAVVNNLTGSPIVNDNTLKQSDIGVIINSTAKIANMPTTSEVEARTLPGADYFVVADYTAPDNTSISNILIDTDTTIPALIAALNNFNPAITPVDLGSVLGSSLTETTAAKLASNLSTFFDNANVLTAKTVDDVGTAVAGGGEFTSTEKNQMRYRLGMDGVTAVPVATPDLSQFDGDLSSLATAAKQTTASVDISNILVDTNELQLSQGDWATPVGFSTAAQVTALDTKVTSILEDTGTTLPALLAGLENLTGAEVKALVVEALTVDTTTEPVSIPTSDASIVDKLSYVFSFAGNKILQTGTAQTLRNSTDTLDISTAALTTDGVTTTRGKHS